MAVWACPVYADLYIGGQAHIDWAVRALGLRERLDPVRHYSNGSSFQVVFDYLDSWRY
jgi:hypothetical protein